MHKTPNAERIHIVLCGLRNSGKSSLLNAIMEKDVAIVSEKPGTTTDPVIRQYELLPLGPVTFVDTAGFDDSEEVIGHKRIEKTQKMFTTADLILFVTKAENGTSELEMQQIQNLMQKGKKIILVTTHCDNSPSRNSNDKSLDIKKEKQKLFDIPHFYVDSRTKAGIKPLLNYISALSLENEITPVEGLVSENDFVVLVTPIDSAAPKGRLILPQVETIRDLLDRNCGVLVVKESELKYFYDQLNIKPKMVITDSQAFHRVASDIPENQALTSFSILFARKKGDINEYIEGLKTLSTVPDNAEILILEACSHHRQEDDIGTVKIPKLFHEKINSTAHFTFAREIPNDDDIVKYHIIIQCGSCMVTRTDNVNRIERIKKHGIKIINYGMFLAWVNGLIPRALEPLISKDAYLQKVE